MLRLSDLRALQGLYRATVVHLNETGRTKLPFTHLHLDQN